MNKFYRTLLGVPNHTSTAGIHSELGRYPIAVNIYSTMLKYWARLVTLPISFLVSHSVIGHCIIVILPFVIRGYAPYIILFIPLIIVNLGMRSTFFRT